MALSFVYGPAGAGKSTYIQEYLVKEAAANAKRNHFLIVPDQFTMQTQLDIVKRHPDGGILNVDVLSFSRLAHRIFEETGQPRETILDDTGKSLVIRHVASRISQDMPYLGKNLDKTGYIHEVKSSISEFMQYSVSPKDIENLSKKAGNGLLKNKLTDLSKIYSAFQDFNKGKYITGEEQLDILCRKLDKSSAIKDSVVVFDGFTGFTPVQERVIFKLLELCKDVIVTLTISEPEKLNMIGGEEKLFYLSRTTANRLISKLPSSVKRGEDAEVSFAQESRFKAGSELMHLEKNLFRYPYIQWEKECSDISIFASENIRAEVDEVCLRILKLIKEKGYSYKDMAIVTGSLDEYADLFERRFKELDIPYFVDRTRGVVLNPFTEYLKSALNIVINNYSYESVFHFLRTGFTEFDRGEVDRFDNYVRSLNIRGKSAYHKAFVRAQRDRLKDRKDKERALLEVERFDNFRENLVKVLAPLEKKAKTGLDYVNNLYEFLTLNKSYEKLLSYADRFEAEGDILHSSEFSRLYKLLMDLLDTIAGLVGDTEMTISEFYKIFDAGIAEITVGTIPANIDRIVVGDIERTRLNEVKALFFTGINDGNIPKNSSKGGILSESDRMFFKSENTDLAPMPREEMYRQKLYLYMNMCKPSGKLILSYSGTNRDGVGQKPAYLIGVITKIFPKINIETVFDIPKEDRILSLNDTMRHFGGLVRKIALGLADEQETELARSIYEVCKEKDNPVFDKMTENAFFEYVSKPLSKEIVDALYGKAINSSITRMEKFAGCAYAHFLQYGLELKEKSSSDFNNADLGSIYHGVLDRFAQKLSDNHLSWKNFSDEQAEQFIDEVVKEYVEEYDQKLLTEDKRHQYTIVKISRIMLRTVLALRFQLQRGRYEPTGFEVPFNRQYILANGTSLNLHGVVDRIDLYEKDGEIYVKIIDYKSGNRDINITNVYFGLEQQLEMYMAEAIKMEERLNPGKVVHPAALLYYKFDNPIVDAGSDMEKVKKEILKSLKMTGIVEDSADSLLAIDEDYENESLVGPIAKVTEKGKKTKGMLCEDEINSLLAYADRMTARIGEEITEGNISISPFIGENKNACQYCSYASVCHFEDGVNGYKSRDEENVTDEIAKGIILRGDTDGDYLFN